MQLLPKIWGKFPDGNLAEALSRLVGVAIDRSNIEGSKVAVRGFGPEFNLVTLNGRQMPTVPGVYNGGRSFDFGDISAHGFESVQVFKTPTAQLPTGGIGSTINIITAKPLNAPGFKGSFSVGGVVDTTDIDDDVTPEIDFFVTNTFLDDRLGLSLSGSHQVRNNREEGLQETAGLTQQISLDELMAQQLMRPPTSVQTAFCFSLKKLVFKSKTMSALGIMPRLPYSLT